MKKLLLVTGLFLIVVNAYCLIPPYLINAILYSNGDVTLNWTPPVDPDSIFNSYHVYSSNSISGPFNKIDSIFSYSQTTKTYTGLGQMYFYMKCRDTNNVYSLSSDTLQSLLNNDVGVIAMLEPNDTCLYNIEQQVTIIVKNFGPDTLSSIPVIYTVKGQVKGTGTWTGVMSPNATDTFTFIQKFIVPLGVFTICARTKLLNDADPSNDSTCRFIYWDIEENSFNNNDISISPNPFSHSTQITLNQTYQNIALAVYDIQGKQVAQQHYTNCSQIQLHRNQLTSGLYFVKLTLDDKAVQTVKMVVGD